MNFLYRTNESRNSFAPMILDRLHSEGLINDCVVIYQGTDIYDESYCYAMNAYYGYHDEYDKICDIDLLPAVSGQIWEKLVPYKDNTLNMMCRHFNMHIMYYDEMEEEYVRHVMFWNDILNRFDIGLCFFSTTPHTPWEYVIYSLAKVKGIPVLIETGCNVHGLARIGTSIENLGENTNAVSCGRVCCDDLADCFSPEVDEFVNNIRNSGLVVKESKRDEANKFYRKWVRDGFIKPNMLRKDDFITALKYIYWGTADRAWQLISQKWDNGKRLKKRSRADKDVRYYDSIATEPDYNEKYVYYAIHYEPEETTLPMGGVFNDQFIAIKMLAETLEEYGIKLYVKENWSQISRRKYYYDRMRKIPNICLINTNVDTAGLIKHAIAVSSITGTCMFEAIINHIPALGFAMKDLESAPGFYSIKDDKDIRKAIDKILSGSYTIDDRQIDEYFKLFSVTHLPSYLDYREVKSEDHFIRAREATYDLLSSYILSGLKTEFDYIYHFSNIPY